MSDSTSQTDENDSTCWTILKILCKNGYKLPKSISSLKLKNKRKPLYTNKWVSVAL